MPFSAQLAMSVSFLQLEILTEAPIETIYSSPVARRIYVRMMYLHFSFKSWVIPSTFIQPE